MLEPGADHLSVMREALSRFCEEIRRFHADFGNMPAPGSPAVHEQAASPRPQSLVTAWSQSAQLIELGSEHITAFVKTITEPVEAFACLTCIRSMLEPCALASWLLDPRIDAHTRVGRTFALRHEGLEQQLKFIRADVRSENYLQEIQGIKDRIKRRCRSSLVYLRLRGRRNSRSVRPERSSATCAARSRTSCSRRTRSLSET